MGYITILIISSYLATISAELSVPTIFPNDSELTIRAGSNITLRCKGNGPLIWDLPKNLGERLEEPAKANISVSENPNKKFKYSSQLDLFNVSAADVGYYTCLYNMTKSDTTPTVDQMVATGKAKRTYLFVEDLKILVLPGTLATTIFLKENTPYTIPCRPSAKDVKLTLTTGFTLIVTNVSLNDFNDRTVSYDSHLGFTIPFAVTKDSGRLFYCTGDIKETSNRNDLLSDVTYFYLRMN